MFCEGDFLVMFVLLEMLINFQAGDYLDHLSLKKKFILFAFFKFLLHLCSFLSFQE